MTTRTALIPMPHSLWPCCLDSISVFSTSALRTSPECAAPDPPTTILSSLNPATCSTSNHRNRPPRTSRKTCPLMSYPPCHFPPASLHAALVSSRRPSDIESGCIATSSHCPPVRVKARSISGGPKNHCVTTIHQTVTNSHLHAARTLLGVNMGAAGGPIEGCENRKTRKARDVQNQPILTKRTLKRLRFCAK